jgi:hypothetical protein
MWRLGLSAALLASACQYDRPADVMPIDARELDAVDAPPPCTPSTIVCDDAAGIYTECDADGSVVRQLTCPLGCATDTEQCLDIDPHNGLAMYLDMVAAPPDVVISGAGSLHAETGAWFDGATAITIPMFIAPADLRVFVVRSLTINGTLTVTPTFALTRSVAIVATSDVVINGRVDLSADGHLAGPGGVPGGRDDENRPCEGAGDQAQPPTPSPGAGGAGASTPGGAGGAASTAAGRAGGAAATAIEPLLGGCQGGSIYDNSAPATSPRGGGGGGGLQIASRTRISLTMAGAIDASGGGASAGFRNIGGAGGGAGGTVLLEAPQVVLDGSAVVISTKGGAGAGASGGTASGLPGADGGTSTLPAAGGTSPVGSPGGRGGSTGYTAEPGGDAQGGSVSGGGGGAAAGVVAIFTANGAINPQGGAAIHGATTVDRLRLRRVP